jgi:hypothetical protein
VAQLRTSLSGLLAHLQSLEQITAVPFRFSDQPMLKLVKRLKQRVADSLSAAARWKAKAKEASAFRTASEEKAAALAELQQVRRRLGVDWAQRLDTMRKKLERSTAREEQLRREVSRRNGELATSKSAMFSLAAHQYNPSCVLPVAGGLALLRR